MQTPSFQESLGRYLNALGLCKGLIELRQLTGGQSNPTFKISNGNSHYVLRKKPGGVLLPSAHAVDREYRVMKALAATDVPVPQMLSYCDDESIIGTAFFIMEYLDGRVFADQSLPGLTAIERQKLYEQMNLTISGIHRLDYVSLGLETFGKPGNYFARQIARWSRQVREANIAIPDSLNKLMHWLPEHIPAEDETSLIHGDFRMDNLIFHKTDLRIIGVLDWELSTLGNPLADFAYQCMAWRIPPTLWRGIQGLDLLALGIPSESEYITMYEKQVGRSISEHWPFLMAYNLFRISAILHGIAKRAMDGNANASDAIENGAKAGALANLGWACAQQ
jgi:aminoglycoside phosphotransferase (APT) family kinase protein